jgi:Sap-like sulfolipid-1-addressing protein
MADVLLLALTAALNPTLVAASTLMMVLPNPRKLMLGYLLGALATSISLGLVIVFTIEDSSAVSTTKKTVSPAATMVLGAVAVVVAFVLGSGLYDRAAERRRARKRPRGENAPPRWQRMLGRGSARVTFLVGAMLTLPGASYLAGLSRIDHLNDAPATTVLVIVGFNMVMLALLEVPLICFLVAPDWTPRAIKRSTEWIRPRARRFGVSAFAVVGTLLLTKGLIEFVS